MKRRKLSTFGIFSPSHTKGKMIRNGLMLRIYNKLKKHLNFKETGWQYIFKGQGGGLVLPYNDGRNEIHVRFYEDHIFAEFEIGRAYLSHFIGPRYNANYFIYDILKPYLAKVEAQYLKELFDNKYKFCHDEIEMKIWEHNKGEDPFIAKRNFQHVVFGSFVLAFGLKYLLLNIGWRLIVIGIGFFIIPTLLFLNIIPIIPTVSVIFAASTILRVLPSKGNP